MRMNSDSGETMWAKEIVYFPNFKYYTILKTLLVKDVAWNLLITNLN